MASRFLKFDFRLILSKNIGDSSSRSAIIALLFSEITAIAFLGMQLACVEASRLSIKYQQSIPTATVNRTSKNEIRILFLVIFKWEMIF